MGEPEQPKVTWLDRRRASAKSASVRKPTAPIASAATAIEAREGPGPEATAGKEAACRAVAASAGRRRSRRSLRAGRDSRGSGRACAPASAVDQAADRQR